MHRKRGNITVKYNISFFDVEKGAPSATIAEYGLTLNINATKMISNWKYAKLGYDKTKKIIIIKPHNNEDEASGSFVIQDKISSSSYLRINSRDFARVIAQYFGLSLTPSTRCLVEWDHEEEILIIDTNKILETSKTED